jgi:hypothetical protein
MEIGMSPPLHNMDESREKNEQKESTSYFDFSEVLNYFFRKKDPNRPTNFNIRMMHGINKISMLMFLICLIVIITRIISRM